MYDETITGLIQRAIAHLQNPIFHDLSARMAAWTQGLSGTAQPSDYFQHPSAVPFLLLPYWLEQRYTETPDLKFQEKLIFSSINAYYFSRMIDDVMDGDAGADPGLLPMLGVFHLNFQSAYQPYFPYPHRFWDFFGFIWQVQAERTIQDHHLTDIDETAFRQIVSRKISGITIPIAAVCFRYKREELVPQWAHFVDLFGCWHMMLNDLTGWNKDLHHGSVTYLLSEARRHNPDEPASWLFESGIDWAFEKLNGWMREMQERAADLPPLLDYLLMRDATLQQQRDKMAKGLKLAAALAKQSRSDTNP